MIYSIQYLRGIAAALVLFEHIAIKGHQFSTNPLSFFRAGGCGVDLFFIISGFIMCQTTQNRKTSIKHFMIARFFRIIPLYWLLTTIALLVFIASPENVNRSGGDTKIIESYLLIPTSGKYLIQNGWTLSYEFLFYSIFAACLAAPHSRFLSTLLIIAIVVTGYFFKPQDSRLIFISHPVILEFCYGIFAFKLWRARLLKPQLGAPLILGGVIGILITSQTGLHDMHGRFIHYGIPTLMLLTGLLSLEGKISKSPNRGLLTLGNASYSIYLTHAFTLAFAAIALRRLNNFPMNYPMAFSMLLILTGILVGVLVYKHIEMPLNNIITPLKIRLSR